jgi:hypothetical protein
LSNNVRFIKHRMIDGRVCQAFNAATGGAVTLHSSERQTLSAIRSKTR